VILVLFHSVDFKQSKCLKQSVCMMGSGNGQKTSEMRRAPIKSLQVILYLHTGTDLAQPIRVVQDSCVKG
jgi:hypothetical protein